MLYSTMIPVAVRLGLLALLAAFCGPAGAQDISEPRANRIYSAASGQALIAVAPGADLEWQVVDDAGAAIRAWAPADPGHTVAVPPGGWYRLMLRRGAEGEGVAVGGRFAAGLVILVTGQSQAQALFHGSMPVAGAWPVTPAEPPQPAVSAVLEDCGTPQPWCAGDHTFWQPAPEGLGARLLLVELQRRLRMPIGLVNAAYGGASAAQLADPGHPAGNRLARLAASAAPLDAAIILGHGTTDAFAPPPPEVFDAAMRQILVRLRHHGRGGMPVLLSELPPLSPPHSVPSGGPSWRLALMRWLGMDRPLRLDPQAEANAVALRAAQRAFATAHGLLDGGSLAGVTPGPDGIHWSEQGVREAARVTARALADALARGGANRREESRR